MDSVSIDNGKFEEIYELNHIAKQSNGSVLYRVNDAVFLATVTFDQNRPVDEDFLPLTVQYIEKSYAAGKFPGGFVKREAKPNDFETLTSRIVDRSLRPLFPKGYMYPTQITVMVLSSDATVDLQCAALNAASAALYISDIPIERFVRAVRVGNIDNSIVVNPTPKELAQSTLDLFVSGVEDELLMIEMRALGGEKEGDIVDAPIDAYGATMPLQGSGALYSANEISEDMLIEVLEVALCEIKGSSLKSKEALNRYRKESAQLEFNTESIDKNIADYIEANSIESIEATIAKMAKSERVGELQALAKSIAKTEIAATNGWEEVSILKAIESKKKELVRQSILANDRRPDGRNSKEIRDITIETNILPNAHSSVLFTRGQTQALVVATIGGEMDAQMYELLNDKGTSKERFMVHYNFPGFSVGEVSMIGPPGRRELGHGNLAKRALECTIEPSCTQTVRLVSEILESNGSSSMATVCGGSLALKAAQIPTTSLVAGVAMGLVMDKERYSILTDIAGIEDHDGDMDFKVAGSRAGITAMQMDIKLGGLDFKVLIEALAQAREARVSIIEKMERAESSIIFNENLPTSNIFMINPSKIVDIIGQAGKTIKEIIERFEVAIDLDRDKGEVKISGANKKKVDAAKEHIIEITGKESNYVKPSELYAAGEKYTGVVKKIVEFGAFIELPKGGDGLLHISKLSKERVNRVTDVLNEGDSVEVEILSINKNKIELALASS